MKTGKIEIVALLDRSGSMNSIKEATVEGFAEFILAQSKLPGEVSLTLVQFDSCALEPGAKDRVNIDTVFSGIKAADMPKVELVPRGCTPLLDAMGTVIKDFGARLASLSEDDRPEHVLFLVMTDGHENASRVYSREQIKAMVEHQQDVYKWTFTFIGAGIDAFAGAGSVGIPLANSVGVRATGQGVKAAYAHVNLASSNLRYGSGYQGGGMGTQDPV